jgi:hypothetical protein
VGIGSASGQAAAPALRAATLQNLVADDPEALARITVFVQSLHGLGWTVGHNLQMDYRFGAGDAERYRRFASELVALAPDVLVTAGAPAVEVATDDSHRADCIRDRHRRRAQRTMARRALTGAQ